MEIKNRQPLLVIRTVCYKDKAVRNYAGMPEIDLDIRKLGTGGNERKSNILSDNIAPMINEELIALQC